MEKNKYELWWSKHHEKGKTKYIQKGLIIGILAGFITAIISTLIVGYPINITLPIYLISMLIVGSIGSLLSWNYYEKKYYGE